MNKSTHIAVGESEWDLRLLDSNGRLWRPNLDMSSSGPEAWFNDPEAGAVAVAATQFGTWVINPAGRIFFQRPLALGDTRDWTENSIKDNAGQLVKAVQIAASPNDALAVDDQKRIWRYKLAGLGSTLGAWLLDKHASNVMSAGLGIDDAVYLDATGELYRHYGRGDTAWESYGTASKAI